MLFDNILCLLYILLCLRDIILYLLDIIYTDLWPEDLFSKEIGQMAKWVAAALGAACDPNGRADAGLRPRVRSGTQTAQNERPSASVWVTRLEMP
jgi:hypothetical protein